MCDGDAGGPAFKVRRMTARRSSLLIPIFCCLVCLAALLGPACSSNQPNVGSTCRPDGGGCDQGLTCDTSVDGGYCTSPCTTSGSTSGCPEGSICTSVSGGPAIECAKICTVQGDCRADLECNGTTGSDIKACRPKL
jgi:hypothetical protein